MIKQTRYAAFLAPLVALLVAFGIAAPANAAVGGASTPTRTTTAAARNTPTAVTPNTYYPGTATSVDNCEVWLNYSGHYIQMLGESWNGADCEMWFDRYHNGSLDLTDPRYLYGTGTFSTAWYWDESPQYETYINVCNLDNGSCAGSGPW